VKDLGTWLDAYSVSHKNKTNKWIHRLCVPAIMWSILGLVDLIQLPGGITMLPLVLVGCLFFYLMLGVKVFMAMALICAPMVFTIKYFQLTWQVYLLVFIVAWIGQFIGHKIEGKKPSFIDDLSFLLIGPLWILGPGVRKLG
tara:strand:+ start:32390 stop:32815 length:426 start_codon:yes stop_codon:yes gene_type:complete